MTKERFEALPLDKKRIVEEVNNIATKMREDFYKDIPQGEQSIVKLTEYTILEGASLTGIAISRLISLLNFLSDQQSLVGKVMAKHGYSIDCSISDFVAGRKVN